MLLFIIPLSFFISLFLEVQARSAVILQSDGIYLKIGRPQFVQSVVLSLLFYFVFCCAKIYLHSLPLFQEEKRLSIHNFRYAGQNITLKILHVFRLFKPTDETSFPLLSFTANF